MSVKTNGAELKAYYHDDAYWEQDAWWDGDAIKVDGEYLVGFEDDKIPDDADVVIESGTVYTPVKDERKEVSIVEHFKNWRKQTNFSFIVVAVEKQHLETVTTSIKSITGVSSVK